MPLGQAMMVRFEASTVSYCIQTFSLLPSVSAVKPLANYIVKPPEGVENYI